jgi:hypothetical protein
MRTLKNTRTLRILIALTTITSVMLLLATSASAVLRANFVSQYGAKVNATTGGNFCSLTSGDTCQIGEVSTIPGGFNEFSPKGVAVAPNGNIYVADKGNNRIEELTPTGEFVLMFGKNVNENGTNICTETEIKTGGKCQTGLPGNGPDEMTSPESVAVDPVSEKIYVAETFSPNDRVDEYTLGGQFVLMIGKKVNETTGGNLCTQTEVEGGAKCKSGEFEIGTPEHGSFLLFGGGNEIAAGGPEHLLYVGSEHRVQEFNTSGVWVGEISLEGISTETLMLAQGVTVDQITGEVYVTYYGPGGSTNIVHRFNSSSSVEIGNFQLNPREAGANLSIEGMTIESNGRLALTDKEEGGKQRWAGVLVDGSTGKPINGFTVPLAANDRGDAPSLSFDASGKELYGASLYRNEVLGYEVQEVAVLTTKPAVCAEGIEQGTLVTFDCTLNGEVNPAGVSETEAWFQLGVQEILDGSGPFETVKQDISNGNASVAISPAVVGSLEPNRTYYYRMAGYDQNAKPPGLILTSETSSVITPIVAPKVLGETSASFVKPASVIMFGELDPENASTKYEFQYGACGSLESCPGRVSTESLNSSTYGRVGVTQEVTGLQPNTTYRYRLVATNAAKETDGPEGSFTTGPSPAVEAVTGPPSAITATSAVISGTVNPDGQAATYTFQLGLYNGAATSYGVVLSVPTGNETVPLPESLALTGLQPGTTYAYRITIHSGYGEALGAIGTFTTAGLPAILITPPSLTQLAVPKISFPKPPPAKPKTCKRGYKRNKRGKCVKANAKPKPKKKSGHKSDGGGGQR